MQEYRQTFDTLLGVKKKPNQHELELFERAQRYIDKLSWIPGIQMISIVNSLSMYATHEDSDIDLFIVTERGMIWLVRLLVTVTLSRHGVWRHGEDIAGNLCLSFFVTTDGISLQDIRIDDDVYLYYWIYYMKPIVTRGDIYDRFLTTNSWVSIDDRQKEENLRFLLPKIITPAFCHPDEGRICSGNKNIDSSVVGMTKKEPNKIYKIFDSLIRFFWGAKTLRKYKKLGEPEGVVISDSMLKFHDKDKRGEIREKIFQKNFDK